MRSISAPLFQAHVVECRLHSGRVAEAGESETVQFSEAPGRVYLIARAALRSGRQATPTQPTLTLLVEDSADGTTWATLATFEFEGNDPHDATVEPRAYMRMRWTLDGGHWDASVEAVAIAAAASENGGSLPSWWTIDSTPGAESVEFAGVVGVAPSDPTLNVLATVTAPTGFLENSSEYTFLNLISETGDRVWRFDASGDMFAYGAETQGHSAFFMRSVDYPTYSLDLQSGSPGGAAFIHASAPDRTAFNVDKAGNVAVGGKLTVGATDGIGLLSAGPTAAPADAAVFAPGVFTLWIDTTNGEAKLMIKARQANAAVVTGSVNLT